MEKSKVNDRAKEFKMPKIPKLSTANKVSKDEEQAENRNSTVEDGEKRKKVICSYYRVIDFLFMSVMLICWGDTAHV